MVELKRIKHILDTRGIVVNDIIALEGGRTNSVYKATSGDTRTPLIIKLYQDKSLDNPLFPNLPHSEITALYALKGTGLAPELVKSMEIDGVITLIYRYVSGEQFQGKLVDAVHLLTRVHNLKIDGVRQLAHHSDQWFIEGMSMLNLAGDSQSISVQLRSDSGIILESLRDAPPLKSQYFLHGDCTVANILSTEDGLVLIDWQCPGIGDPIEDYATLASTAMHYLSNREAPSEDDEEAMIAKMDADLAKRYRLYSPLLKWRIACYCVLRASQLNDEALSTRYLNAAVMERGNLNI